MKINIDQLRKKSLDFIDNSSWANNCNDSYSNININIFENIVNNAFNIITKDKKQVKHPFIFRIGGQSGSGKTTQLMPSIKNITDDNNNFIHIAVRTFVKFHPNYNELLEKFGNNMIREKTNYFALLMLFRIMEKLIQNKYNIILEVTILDCNFEKYLFQLAKYNRYNIHFHILSIPKEKSNCWIEKRKKTSTTEGNRTVLKSSSDYFYDVLPETLNKMINFNFWNKNDKIFLWNGFDLKPVFYDKIYKNKKFIFLFNFYRKLIGFKEVDETVLLNAKIKWFNEYYGGRIYSK